MIAINFIYVLLGIEVLAFIVMLVMGFTECKRVPKNRLLTSKEEQETMELLANSYAFNNETMIGYIKTLSENTARENIKQIIKNDLGGKDNTDMLVTMIVDKIKIFHRG